MRPLLTRLVCPACIIYLSVAAWSLLHGLWHIIVTIYGYGVLNTTVVTTMAWPFMDVLLRTGNDRLERYFALLYGLGVCAQVISLPGGQCQAESF